MVYCLLLGAIWTQRGPANKVFVGSVAACIIAFLWKDVASIRELGFRLPSTSNILKILGTGLLLSVLLYVLSVLTGQIHQPSYDIRWHDAWQYTIWAVVQQFILQTFFYVRLESLLGSRRALWAAAALFSAAHIPSPLLTVATFAGGLIFCELYRRYRSIVPLGLIHAALGLTIAASFSDAWLHHMRVGIGYLTFHG